MQQEYGGGGVNYDDEHGRNDLCNDDSRKVLPLGNAVHGFCQNDDTFSQNDQRQETATFVQVGPLEANHTPLRRTEKDHNGFEQGNSIPSEMRPIRGIGLETKQQPQTYGSANGKNGDLDKNWGNGFLIAFDPEQDRAVLNDEYDSAND